MVLNLLDNAARHTPPGSRIELRLRAEGGDAVLEVADDGPGIPPELRDQVFDRFVRGDGPGRHRRRAPAPASAWRSSRRRHLPRRHVEAAESRHRAAPCFRVRLPLAKSEPANYAGL